MSVIEKSETSVSETLFSEGSVVVGGMSCGACAARIERQLNSLDGVVATVNFATERARVVLEGSTSMERVVEEIRSAGFSAEPVEPAEAYGDASKRADSEADVQVRRLGRRLLVAAIFSMPLCDVSLAFSLIPSIRFPGWQWLLIALAAPVVTWCALLFYKGAIAAARHGTSTMDTLVSMGIAAATGWSLYAMFHLDTNRAPLSLFFVVVHQGGGAIYIDVAAGVTTFLLAGRYFEASSRRRSGNALRSLASVGARFATVINGPTGAERMVRVGDLVVGDVFVVRAGETIPTDGEILSGHSDIDKSAMTGESVPKEVAVGDEVVGGTVCVGGFLTVRATRVGAETQLAHMMRLVEEAQNRKAAVQRLADRISGIFVPIVVLIAAGTLTAWLVVSGSTERAFSAAISVLIIACPCALGLATPAALLVASGFGAARGIFFKGYRVFEASRQVDTVVLDKTGTITTGKMTVAQVASAPGVRLETVVLLAGAVEQASEHVIAGAIADYARTRAVAEKLPAVGEFRTVPGAGASGSVDGHEVRVGTAAWVTTDTGAIPELLAAKCREWEKSAKTVVLVGRDGEVIGAIALSDSIRPSAAAAVSDLRALGLRCIVLSGDNETTTRSVGEAIGVTEVIAGATPARKVEVIEELQAAGRSVAMVGDGVNDAPALVAADLGLAVGSGTDVARNAADLIVVRDDLTVVATAIGLARRTLSTIRGNLVWAFAYNVVAIPLAACGFLNPLIAGAAMVLSSGFVVWNSSRLGHTGSSPGWSFTNPDAVAARDADADPTEPTSQESAAGAVLAGSNQG
jgi:Cu+-exporting ATPase